MSQFYERLPKPWAIAVQEMLEEKIYLRDTEEIEEEESSVSNQEIKDA